MITTYFSFILISIGLIVIPGPNVLLILSNSMTEGIRRGLITVAGTSSAMIVQLTLTTLAVSSVMVLLAGWFEWIRFLGVVYLIFLGIQQWRQKPETEESASPTATKSSRLAFWQGFAVSLTNPKTLLIFAAFFPQFIDSNQAALPQMALLSITFLFLATVFDSCYAVVGEKLRVVLHSEGRRRIRNRIVGSLLVGAGVGLALARRGG